VPVSPRCSRRKSTSVVRTSTVAVRGTPFTRTVTAVLVSSAGTVDFARTGLRRGAILALGGRLTMLARFFIYLCCHRERRRRVAIREALRAKRSNPIPTEEVATALRASQRRLRHRFGPSGLAMTDGERFHRIPVCLIFARSAAIRSARCASTPATSFRYSADA